MNKIGKREFTEQICFGHKNTINFHVGVDIVLHWVWPFHF